MKQEKDQIMVPTFLSPACFNQTEINCLPLSLLSVAINYNSSPFNFCYKLSKTFFLLCLFLFSNVTIKAFFILEEDLKICICGLYVDMLLALCKHFLAAENFF